MRIGLAPAQSTSASAPFRGEDHPNGYFLAFFRLESPGGLKRESVVIVLTSWIDQRGVFRAGIPSTRTTAARNQKAHRRHHDVERSQSQRRHHRPKTFPPQHARGGCRENRNESDIAKNGSSLNKWSLSAPKRIKS